MINRGISTTQNQGLVRANSPTGVVITAVIDPMMKHPK